MKTTIKNYKGEQFEIETYFAHEFKGRGGWNINCEVSFKGEKKTFRHYTTDSMFIDQISDMKADDASWDEIQNAYKEKAFDSIEESILEWCEEINEKEEENAFISALDRVQEIQRKCLGTEAHFDVKVRTFDDGDLGIMVTIHKADLDVFLHPCLYSAAYSNNAAGRKKFFNEITTPLKEWGIL